MFNILLHLYSRVTIPDPPDPPGILQSVSVIPSRKTICVLRWERNTSALLSNYMNCDNPDITEFCMVDIE